MDSIPYSYCLHCTKSQEYKEAKGAKNAKTLEVRPKKKSFSFPLATFWYASKTTEARIQYRFRTAPLRSSFSKISVYQIVFVVCM